MSDPFKDALRKMKTCPDCKNDLVCHDQGECLRPTPETDAAKMRCFCRFDQGGIYDAEAEKAADGEWVPCEVAEALERQRDEARATCEELITDSNAVTLAATVVRLERQLAEAREENARLREALVECWRPLRASGNSQLCERIDQLLTQ